MTFARAAALGLVGTLMTAVTAQAGSVKRLTNGLRYVVLEDHASPVVSLQIWVRCGGVNEEGPTSGVSHFLEHMIFKGTDKISANEISKIVESNGGSINAATGGETTQYYIDIPSKQWEKAFDVLAESVMRPAFPPLEFEKERKVILEEIKRRNDDPRSDLWDVFLEGLYRRTPYRQQVIGSVETITAMTRDLMVRQHALFYVPNNVVVVVAGDVQRAAVEKKIKKIFGALPAGPTPPQPALLEPPVAEPAVQQIYNDKAQQAHVALGFVGPTLKDPDQVVMDVLSTALGGGQSSRLYQKLREEKRQVWSISASFITHAGSGAFGIFAECPPEKTNSLPNDVYFLLGDVEFNGFTVDEVERAKAQIRSSWLFGQETYHGQASQWGFYTALGAPEVLETYLAKLDRVTAADLGRALTKYSLGRPLSGVVVKPRPVGGGR
jgi:zinc protease